MFFLTIWNCVGSIHEHMFYFTNEQKYAREKIPTGPYMVVPYSWLKIDCYSAMYSEHITEFDMLSFPEERG